MSSLNPTPTSCEHGRTGTCGVTMYCRDLDRHVKADYESHDCETWWFCPGGIRIAALKGVNQ